MRGSAESDETAEQNVVHFGVASNIVKLWDSGVGEVRNSVTTALLSNFSIFHPLYQQLLR